MSATAPPLPCEAVMAQKPPRAAIGAVLAWAAAVPALFFLCIVPQAPLLMDALLVAVVAPSMTLTVRGPGSTCAVDPPRPDRAPAPAPRPTTHPHQRRTTESSTRARTVVSRPSRGLGGHLDACVHLIARVEPNRSGHRWAARVRTVDRPADRLATRSGLEQTSAEDNPSRARSTRMQPGGSRIVQSPRCGAFEVAAEPRADSLRLRTRAHSWTWAPGRAWPPTVVGPTGTSRDGVHGPLKR